MSSPPEKTKKTTTVEAHGSMELGEAEKLCESAVKDWFERRIISETQATMVDEVDKRLFIIRARDKLVAMQSAFAKSCVADVVAQAIMLTLYK